MKWIKAFRIRTLPLAFSCIIMGSGLAMADGRFNLRVFLLALVTTLFLQILSNLANDYGDFVKGTDNEDRVGPDRTMQAGLITKDEMVNAMWVIAILCSVFGVWLIYKGTLGLDLSKAGLFAVLGLTAMGVAVKYTMGKNPYGYAGLGDVFVFLFFGWLGVLGSYFLHAHSFRWDLLLPASSIGLFTTAVLNINNMRDHKADAKFGKNTLVVRMGIDNAKSYHQALVYSGILLALVYVMPSMNYFHYAFLLSAPLFIGSVQNMRRRTDFHNFDPFLKKQALTTVLFTILFVGGINLGIKKSQPNIVLIFTDDQGYADVGVYGARGYSTPNLDQMADEGMRFTDFHVSQAVCSASRAALLTGCYSERVGVQGAYNHTARVGLNPEEETIAEILKNKGYATAAFGKWHLGHHEKFLPLQQGFDEYFGVPYSNDMWPVDYSGAPVSGTDHFKSFYPQLPLIEGNEKIEEIRTLADQDRLTTRYTERAVKFIEKNKDNPFFLYLPHSMPHVPLGVSDKFKGKSQQGMYGDVIMEIDWSVGEILKALKANGLDENTLVIFTSDNGPWLNYGNHAGLTGPLREGKGAMWEGGARVPAIMRWPGKIPHGFVSNQLTATVDILPTIADIVGVDLPKKKIDGISFKSHLVGKSNESPRKEYNYYYVGELVAVRQGKWKLTFPHEYRSYLGVEPGNDGYPGPYARGNAGIELYDLENDISESYNVAEQFPKIVTQLKELGQNSREELGDRITKTKGSGVRPIGRLDLDRSEDELNVNHLGIGKLVSYKHPYSPHYPGGEAFALVDGKRGTINHHDGFWQGFARNDIEVVIDLESLTSIKKLGISFLQNQGAWIFFPKEVRFEVSVDGVDYQLVQNKEYEVTKSPEILFRNVNVNYDSNPIRYIKVTARNQTVLPSWHPAQGNAAWLFADEIVIQ